MGLFSQGGYEEDRCIKVRRTNFLEESDHALHPHGKTNGRVRGSSQLLHETVVASTACNGILSAQLSGLDFESGAGVVVQTSHQMVIQHKRDARSLQMILERLKMPNTFLTYGLNDGWSGDHHLFASGNLAIEYPQWIGLGPPPAIAAQALCLVSKIAIKQFLEAGPAGRAPKRIDVESQIV